MNQAPTLPTGVGEIEFFHWFFPSASSGSIQRLNYVVRNVGVSRPFVLLKESLVFDIQARCVDWPTATGDGCSSSTENCSLEALVSLLDWDAARRDGYNTSLQLATEQVPVGFTEVPSLLGWAVDNRSWSHMWMSNGLCWLWGKSPNTVWLAGWWWSPIDVIQHKSGEKSFCHLAE